MEKKEEEKLKSYTKKKKRSFIWKYGEKYKEITNKMWEGLGAEYET